MCGVACLPAAIEAEMAAIVPADARCPVIAAMQSATPAWSKPAHDDAWAAQIDEGVAVAVVVVAAMMRRHVAPVIAQISVIDPSIINPAIELRVSAPFKDAILTHGRCGVETLHAL